MLQTCNRCRTRRIKCDALLPACANCAKVNFQCSFRDDVLQENIPRSYIKGLYDRINELNSLLSVQKFQTDGGLQHAHQISNPSNQTPAHHILASKSGQYLYLGPSPPAIIGCSAISRLLSLDFAITPPPILVGAEGTEEVCDISKLDRSIISPSAIRLLLAHYDRCIRPLYPIKLSNFASETETSLKHLTELERFKVLIACAIAASHKSYHVPSWKTIAKVARDWAGELAVSIVAMRDDEAVVALLLLLVYELTDSEKAIIWELLGFAIRFCLELGWHRLEQDTMALPTENADPQDQPSQLSDADKRQLMSVLHSIERPLRVIFQRPSMLSGCKNLSGTQEDLIFETYMQISTHLFGSEAPVETNHCPMSPATFHLIASLDQLPFQNQLVLESWILFFPICVDHIPCDLCSSTLNRPGPADLSTIRTTILRAAIQLLSLIHAVVSSGDVFIPPLMASSKAFTAGCVLVVGMTSGWAGTENYIGPLLKCSEVMAFCAPLWKGGKEYHEVWRKVAGVI